MVWSAFDYKVDGYALSNLCESVRVLVEGTAGKRGTNPTVQYQDGDLHVPKFWMSRVVMLECVIRYTSAAGTITHTDGAAGHVYENMSELKRRLVTPNTVLLGRTVPHWGDVEATVEVQDPMTYGADRTVLAFPLLFSRPFWRVATENTGGGPPSISTDGDAPTDDIRVTFPAAAVDPRLTDTTTGDYIELDGTVPTGGVEVDCAARTVTKLSDSSDYGAYFHPSRESWLRFPPQSTITLSYTGGGSVSVDWYDKVQ